MRVTFQHLRDTKNVGDRWCSPYDWFAWPFEASVKDIRTAGEAYDIGILGGGKIFGGLSQYMGVQQSPATINIAWGVSTVQSFPISLKYAKARKICSLVGSRDWGDRRFDWAPCASCMAPLFDAPQEAEHDIVFYYHGGKTQSQGISIPSHIPSLSNNASSLDEAISFIGSGKTVVSNSYHGVLWGLLLGRRVLCIPFSNKFYGYRLPPGYAKPGNWLEKLGHARAQPELLELSRTATLRFHGRVVQMIEAFR